MSSFHWPDTPRTTHFLCHRDDGRHLFSIDQWGYWYDPEGDPEHRLPTSAMIDSGYLGVRTDQVINPVIYENLLFVVELLHSIMGESRGVDGYHKNGDVADWSEFDELDGLCELITAAKGGAK